MKKAQKVPLSFQVAEKIRVLIRKNELVSGMRLSEPNLCERLGVSRTPLREAFRMLIAEGLVEIRLNKGAYVADPPLEDVSHMFEAMGIMEGNCARLACERLLDSDLAELEKLHKELKHHYKNQDHERYMDCNNKYHTFVQEKAGNPVLSKMVSSLRDVILLHRYRQIYRLGRFKDSMEEHQGLIEAFRARDGERAERLMRAHLQKQGQALVSYYAELGQSMVKNN
jgi:DNA-binding GntR family transcriptional regulator